MKKALSLLVCLIFGFTSLTYASEVHDIDWAQKVVEKTVNNLKQLDSTDDFEILLAKKKKRKKRRRKRRRQRKKKKKDNRMSQKHSKKGRFYLEGNIGGISHNSLTEEEIEEQIGTSVINYSVEGSSIGFSFGGGYYLKEWFALEGAYSILGVEKSSFNTTEAVEIERTFSAIEINAKLAYWMGEAKNFALYAKPGLALWSLSVDQDNATSADLSESASGTSFTFGLGGEYFLNHNFYMGAGLMLYPSLGNDELGSQGHTKYFISAGFLF